MASSTTFPILDGAVQAGDLKSYELFTVEEEPDSGMREHDRLVLVFPSGNKLTIDTICSGIRENVSIYIDNAEAP